jgi:hypothetical protein
MSKKIKKFSEYIKESSDINLDILKPFKMVIDKDKVVDKVVRNKIYKIEL